MVDTLQELQSRSVDLVNYQERTDTPASMGRAMFQIFEAMSELEANLVRERVLAGVELLWHAG